MELTLIEVGKNPTMRTRKLIRNRIFILFTILHQFLQNKEYDKNFTHKYAKVT